MTDFTRLTVIGATHKAELVVPSDDTVGALIPRIMELLEERSGPVARPLTLVRPTGEQLDLSLSASAQSLCDGEVLRLMRLETAPPPPMVADVTDVVAEALGDRRDLWSAAHRRGIGSAGIAVATLAAGFSVPTEPAAVLGIGVVVLLVAAVITGRSALRWPATALTAAAVGLSLPLAAALVTVLPRLGSSAPLNGACLAALFVWLSLGIGAGLGLRMMPALRGAAIGVVFAALPVILLAAGVDAVGTAGITGVVAVAACGLLPWYAMSSAGLTGLDDQVAGGQTRHRDDVVATISDSYRGLTWSTIAVAIPLAATGAFLVTAPGPWSLALGIAIALVTALRTRAFPLATQASALWLAAGTIAIVGIVVGLPEEPWVATGVLVALALLCALGVGTNPSPHQRASLRRLGNFTEALAIIVMIPVLLGVFDIYAELLGTF